MRNGTGQKAVVVGNEFGSDRRAVPEQVVEVARPALAKSATLEMIRALEDQVRDAQKIVLSLPGDRLIGCLRGGKSCLGSLVISEVGEDDEANNGFVKTPKQITRAQNLMEILVSLRDIDPFAVKIVLLRAMPKAAGWKRIEKMDPRGRGRRQLFNLHREALVALWDAIQKKK